jgi:5'-nucleotidase
MKDLVTVVPMQDPLMVLEVPGNVLHEALENGVSGECEIRIELR